MARRHVRRGDLVMVICGKYRGQQGRLVEVLTEANRVRVEGIAKVKRHLKPGRDPKAQNGGIVERLGSVHISNVALIDPDTKKATRTRRKLLDGGKKVRVATATGKAIGEAF